MLAFKNLLFAICFFLLLTLDCIFPLCKTDNVSQIQKQPHKQQSFCKIKLNFEKNVYLGKGGYLSLGPPKRNIRILESKLFLISGHFTQGLGILFKGILTYILQE